MLNQNNKTMKSIKFLAAAGAVALLSTVGFTSCEKKNGPDNGSGTYSGETVKTQFSISIPEVGKTAKTAAPGVQRMPGNNTQQSGNFLGMDNIVLMPYNVNTTDIESGDTRLGNIINLSTLGGDIATGGLSATAAKYKVYSNVSIPLGTNHFLFYAHGTAPSSTEDEKFAYGQLTATNVVNNNLNHPSNISFDLVSIPLTNKSTEETNLATYLTNIATANDGSTENGHTWATYSLTYGGDDGIKKLYDDFVTLRAGSAMSILKTVEDLYNSLEMYNEAYKASHSGTNDAVVKAVMDSILNKAHFTGDGGVGTRTLAWDAFAGNNYPRSLNLPDGAASVKWNGSQFDYATDLNYNSFGVSNPASYVYPSCIYYYVNSTLETSTEKESTKYGDKTWNEILTDLYDAETYVNTSTRSVAIVKPIQYGVALLKTNVAAANSSLSDYYAINNTLGVTGVTVDATQLTMTGVLVGGQGTVGFDFVPTSSEPGSKVIYDKTLDGTGTWNLNTTTSYNYTLLLETPANKAIYVAIEFENGDKDFYGEGGKLIPKGTKFYVVGQLSSSTTSDSRTKVFEQDYTTTANFTISNLSKAYNVVPDLRTESLELGFSVDLNWETGNTYTIDIN